MISRIHLILPHAYKQMCFDRNINENRSVKFLESDYLLVQWCVKLTLKWCPLFDCSTLPLFTKCNNLWACWFLAKNRSNFVSLSLDNPYYRFLSTAQIASGIRILVISSILASICESNWSKTSFRASICTFKSRILKSMPKE